MEHETFYATAAQILPAIAVAAGLELRFFIKRLDLLGSFDPPRNFSYWVVHIYTRVLALATLGAVLLMISCLWALKTENQPWYLDNGLYYVLGLAPIAMALPFVGAVFKPRDLLRWYGGTSE